MLGLGDILPIIAGLFVTDVPEGLEGTGLALRGEGHVGTPRLKLPGHGRPVGGGGAGERTSASSTPAEAGPLTARTWRSKVVQHPLRGDGTAGERCPRPCSAAG